MFELLEQEMVSHRLDSVAEFIRLESFRTAREILTDLRQRPITDTEGNRLYALVDSMPEHERPLCLDELSETTKVIRQTYGSTVATMSKDEFILFAQAVFHGEIPLLPGVDKGCPLLIYAYLRLPTFSIKEAVKLFVYAIDATLVRLHRQPCRGDEDRELLLKSLELAGESSVDVGYDAILRTAELCLQKGYLPGGTNRWGKPVEDLFDGVFEATLRILGGMFARNPSRQLDAQTMLSQWCDNMVGANSEVWDLYFDLLLTPA
jgi:hypothetical protein